MPEGGEMSAERRAAMAGDVASLEALRAGGADLEAKFGGWSLLHTAVWAGRPEAAAYLIRQGLKPEEPDLGGSNSLHLAARQGWLDVCRVLISSAGGERLVNEPGANGSKPLHLAARRGHTEVVRLLLEHSASRDVRDILGKTPLDWALRRGHHEIALLLAD